MYSFIEYSPDSSDYNIYILVQLEVGIRYTIKAKSTLTFFVRTAQKHEFWTSSERV